MRSKRPKRISDDEYVAGCLIALAQSGDDASFSTAAGASKPSHKCNLCDKVFMSHQALGGHKSSHRSRPASKNNASTSTAAEASSGPLCHQCSTCGRRFASGQALGGHMRKHYVGVIELKIGANSSNGRSVVTSSSNSVAVSYSGSNELNFSPELDLTLRL